MFLYIRVEQVVNVYITICNGRMNGITTNALAYMSYVGMDGLQMQNPLGDMYFYFLN